MNKFKDVSLFVHDYEELLARLATHEDMIEKKVTLCNEKLGKLNTLLYEVATNEKGWTMSELIGELEQLDELFENLYRGFQQWCKEYNVY